MDIEYTNMLKIIKANNKLSSNGNWYENIDVKPLKSEKDILFSFLGVLSSCESNSGLVGEDQMQEDDLTDEEVDDWYADEDREPRSFVSYSPSSKSIFVANDDYHCYYPLRDLTNGSVDYKEFINREM